MPEPKVTGSPEVIHLVYGELERDDTHAGLMRDGEVTWCKDKVHTSDVAYIRADLMHTCKGAPGECAHHGACMYACSRQPVLQPLQPPLQAPFDPRMTYEASHAFSGRGPLYVGLHIEGEALLAEQAALKRLRAVVPHHLPVTVRTESCISRARYTPQPEKTP